MPRRLLLAFFLVALGCGTNTEVESQVTITQGLYGQLTKRCDKPGCVGAPIEGTPVAWFKTSPFSTTDGGVSPMPVQETVSKTNGFYELAIDSNERGYLALGRHETTQGTVWFTATSALIPRGLARIDWRGSEDNEGIWTDAR
jgi:hypothetical protein